MYVDLQSSILQVVGMFRCDVKCSICYTHASQTVKLNIFSHLVHVSNLLVSCIPYLRKLSLIYIYIYMYKPTLY